MDSFKKPIPKYYQIYEVLLDQIRSGEYEEHDRFPSDTELVEQFDVSRGTVREAVKLLLQQGYLIRHQGKGTYVTFKKIQQDPEQLMGFSELMKRHNMEPTASVVVKEIISPPPHIKKLMHLENTDQLVRLVRVRYGNNQPLIIERSFFNHALFKPFIDQNLEENSIFDLLHQHTSHRLGNAVQQIEAISAGKSEHELLHVNLGTPLLLIKRLIQTTEDTYFQYSEDVYRSDRIHFKTQTEPYGKTHSDTVLPLELTDSDW